MSFLILQEISEDGERSQGENSTQIDNEGNFQKFFLNDIVCRTCKHNKNQNSTVEIGIVCYPKYLARGERLENIIRNGFIHSLCVYWFNSKSEEVVRGDEIQLVDRDISEGMTVKREGFVGTVIDSTKFGVVRCLKTNQIIANVQISALHPFQKAQIGDKVMHSSGWLGVIVQEDFVSIIHMKDGKKCSCKWSRDALTNSPKVGSMADRIKFVGQPIRLSKYEAIFGVTWQNRPEGHFGWLTASKFLDGVVQSIETILHATWLHNITTPGISESPPDFLIPINSTEYTVVRSNENVTVGSIMELECQHQESWQRHSYEKWLSSLYVGKCQRCTEKSMAFDLDTKDDERDVAIEPQNKGHGDQFHCESGSSTDAISLWRTLYSRSSMTATGESLAVEVLYFTTWVTISWSNGFTPLDYRPAHEVEPLLLNDGNNRNRMRLGSIVKFAKLIQNQPLVSSYYGIIKSVGHGYSSVDWFHISTAKNPVFIGAAKLQMDLLELHPMWNYPVGEILVTEGIVLEPELSIGTFQNVASDGLFVVQLLNGMKWRYNPTFLRRLYDIEGMRQVDANVKESVSYAFKKMQPWSPSLFNISCGRTSFSMPPKCQFIDLNSSAQLIPKSVTTQDIVGHIEEDLHRYNGGSAPTIWLKTFLARKDIILVAMEGSPSTLYEDVLFFFTIELSDSYPNEPPIFLYHSCSPEQVNPCLNVNGTVLCPLLNSYPNRLGFRHETWDPEDPSIGIILLCIQKIMLGSVPYENDSSFGLLQLISSSWCNKICRKNNLKYTKQLITTVKNQITNPPEYWERECIEYYRCHAPRFYNRIRDHICCSNDPDFYGTIPLPQPISFDTVRILTPKLEDLRQIYDEKFTNHPFNV